MPHHLGWLNETSVYYIIQNTLANLLFCVIIYHFGYLISIDEYLGTKIPTEFQHNQYQWLYSLFGVKISKN